MLNLHFKTIRIPHSLSFAWWQKLDQDSEILDSSSSSDTTYEFRHHAFHSSFCSTSLQSCGELGLMLTVESNVFSYITSVGPHHDPVKEAGCHYHCGILQRKSETVKIKVKSVWGKAHQGALETGVKNLTFFSRVKHSGAMKDTGHRSHLYPLRAVIPWTSYLSSLDLFPHLFF